MIKRSLRFGMGNGSLGAFAKEKSSPARMAVRGADAKESMSRREVAQIGFTVEKFQVEEPSVEVGELEDAAFASI